MGFLYDFGKLLLYFGKGICIEGFKNIILWSMLLIKLTKDNPILIHEPVEYPKNLLKKGDHIVIQRKHKNLPICYYHHGIISDVDSEIDKIMVIHPYKTNIFSDNVIKKENILDKLIFLFDKDYLKETTLNEFIGKPERKEDEEYESYIIEIMKYSEENIMNKSYCYTKLSDDEIINNAHNMIMEQKKYKIGSFNCETFALRCSTGNHELQSLQAIELIKWVQKYKSITSIPEIKFFCDIHDIPIIMDGTEKEEFEREFNIFFKF